MPDPPRSGLALRHGITLPNTPATIDSDYRGELKVALINLGPSIRGDPGMRIAQLVVARVERAAFRTVEELPATAGATVASAARGQRLGADSTRCLVGNERSK